jgi:hypothetical protein
VPHTRRFLRLPRSDQRLENRNYSALTFLTSTRVDERLAFTSSMSRAFRRAPSRCGLPNRPWCHMIPQFTQPKEFRNESIRPELFAN